MTAACEEGSDPPQRQPGGRRAVLHAAGVLVAGAVASACRSTAAPTSPPTTRRAPPPTTAPPATVPPTTAPPPPTTAPPTTAPPPPTTAPPTTAPPTPSGWPDAASLHAARRLSWGATPQLTQDIHSAGLAGWVDAQLAYLQIDDSHVAPRLAAWPRPTWAPSQLVDDHPWRIVQEQAAHDTIRRIFSRRQLHEVVVDFWHDHFNIDIQHSFAGLHFGGWDRDVIRPLAFGRFRDLLPAVAAAPAMLHYLDQAASRADGGRTPNENYARELMELHTVGTASGYTQADVTAIAHLLSGWSVAGSNQSQMRVGGFQFRAGWHHLGPLASDRVVLGWSRGALTGEAAGRSFLDHLARHPATARRVCHKLAVRLIGEHVAPGDAVVDAAVAAWQANDTAIGPVVRTLVLSGEFAASAGAKVRRPSDQFTQLARAVGVGFDDRHADKFLWANWNLLSAAGNAPHSWPPPNGFPDRNRAWLSVSSMVWRWNLAVWFAHGSVSALTYDARSTQAWAPNARWGEWLDELARRIVGEPWPPAVRSAVLAHYGVNDSTPFRSWDHWAATAVVAVLLQTPALQRR